MSIFSRIRDAIFHHAEAEPSTKELEASATQKPAAMDKPFVPMQPPSNTGTSGIPASPTAAKWDREVDVEAVLQARAASDPQKLNWRTSIVDLMKLLDIDSSLENRKQLAKELGYTGSTDDSAAMNVWLHRRVMEELRNNGGKVPASLVA